MGPINNPVTPATFPLGSEEGGGGGRVRVFVRHAGESRGPRGDRPPLGQSVARSWRCVLAALGLVFLRGGGLVVGASVCLGFEPQRPQWDS